MFFNEIYYYNKCVIYLNHNNTKIIEDCLKNTGGNNIYNTDAIFNIPKKYNCDNNKNKEMYKDIVDQSLEVTKCFINNKNKIYYNEIINCNKINNNIDFEKRYKCIQ